MAHLIVPRGRAVPARRSSSFGFYDDLDRVFDELWRGFSHPLVQVGSPGLYAPRVDFTETDDEIRVAAELPGLEEKDIAVALNDGVLTIEGERKDEHEEGDEAKGFRHVETFRGSFRRAIRLPADIDEKAVTATYKAGVLTVTLPKLPQEQPEARTIPITSG
ncbi:MAG: Hsp20/alpha crystallin family protein [Myxococcales bacterium]|nr:Hsp20/alpha crystallin family protein [Myxococcales bacterium]MDH5567631.1 Hsp20/alpha crystallin family protein [Myxococcales bacterium]